MRGNNAVRAAWVAAIAALFALPVSCVSLGYTIWADRVRVREEFTVSVNPVLGDYPIVLTDVPGTRTGTVATYWSILIANNGSRDASLVAREIREIRGDGEKIDYHSLDQGLFTTSLSRLDLPVNISAGNAVRFYLKVGLLMGEEAYKESKDFWQAGSVGSFRQLLERLATKNLYIYSENLKNPKLDLTVALKSGQVFLATFRSARRTVMQTTFYSWHAAGP
jgi:hypothetical protein